MWRVLKKLKEFLVWAVMGFFVIAISISRTAGAEQTSSTELCEGIIIKDGELSLSESDRILVCGTGKKPWGKPAPAEAKKYLKATLQKRGYHHPEFSTSGKVLVVVLGKRTLFSRLDIAPAFSLDAYKFRAEGYTPLTSALLDEVGSWVEQELNKRGYACPEVVVSADPTSGVVTVRGDRKKRYRFPELTRESVPSLDSQTLKRLDAFVPNQWFNPDLLALTEARASRSPVVSSVYHLVSCEKNHLAIRQNVVGGAVRSIRVGLGVNTEVGPVVRAQWSHGRVNSLGSVFDVQTRNSLKEQTVEASLKWYLFPNLPRLFYDAGIEINHHRERHARWIDGKIRFFPGYDMEFSSGRLSMELGPLLNATKRFEGPGISDSIYLTWKAQFDWLSHYYELLRSRPVSGNKVHFGFLMGVEDLFAPVNFRQYQFRMNQYFNVGNFSPSIWVLALRLGGATTTTDSRALLPADNFHFLGGMANVRGFARQSLPGPQGALTTLYAGFELRLSDLILGQFTPVLSVDAAKLGIDSFTLDPGFYWSPGMGLQWNSPVGAFRLTTAFGFSEEGGIPVQDSAWQVYLSLGEEF